MRSSHVSQRLRYVSRAWILSTFGVSDLQRVSAFRAGSGFLPSVSVLCLNQVQVLAFHIRTPLFSTDFISVTGACVSPVQQEVSWMACPDLPAMGSGLHLGANCQQWGLLDASQAPNLHFATQLLKYHSCVFTTANYLNSNCRSLGLSRNFCFVR